ncbi:membrane fusion protein, multidrug efflux system [Chitinophaga rupis]|uniref:Membrane fusion protein, multidrug efflux system n=1 Tax=Chitinophaga rupis TaxID=573321 RepID=A0A1H7QI81_9BACT|nr:HlyD family secretion protein [Chitinophaga rupis]SEL47364.1 membrane fusion protein, multidrug efflux system [Chitinophaga rupis]
METQVNEVRSTSNKTGNAAPQEQPPKRNMRFIIILAVLVIGGAIFGISKYVHALHHEETDNAQIDANVSPVIPRVSGYVTSIRVKDNQDVKKGDTLIVLDDRDLQIKLQQAEAALVAAQANVGVAQANTEASQVSVTTSRANVATVNAQIEAAKVEVWRTSQDYERYANLIKDHSITQQQYEQALAAKQTAERQLQVLQEQKAYAAQQTNGVASQSNATARQIAAVQAVIKEKEADVNNAKLNLSYTVITAPEAGRVSKVYVQPGQYLQAGQSLFSIVTDNSVWVVANFKETQLDKMKVGQKVSVHVDAFPEKSLDAHVSSFSPATGARFALLPPDNATGNFVKVVQRLPVKIEFDNPNDPVVKQLRAGLNVDVDVHLD